MDTRLILKALCNVMEDGEAGCILDTLSVKVDAPKYDASQDHFIQHILFCVDRICTPSDIGFLHRLEEEYNRLCKD